MDTKVVAGALFDGSVIALVAAATTVCYDLFGFLNLMLAGAFILGAAEESAFAATGSPQWERVAAGALAAAIAGFLFDRFALSVAQAGRHRPHGRGRHGCISQRHGIPRRLPA